MPTENRSTEQHPDDSQTLTEQHAPFISLDDDLMMSGAADFQDAAYALELERDRAAAEAERQNLIAYWRSNGLS
ncbi:hypothetical protein [Pseudomonas qingdaonensis]|jgi:hypothetical protein|uniref:hypothetical protein n=1 Tax=Pseudomonas qingdaonensis TaxID=2056231 RepID=UPI001F2A4D3F|nr:hypothetical protein [Pseudomonas qingdaonensis]